MSELVRVSLSIEKGLFEKLEKLVERSTYSNRSEFVRDLVRDRLVAEEWDANAEAIGTIQLIYDHHAGDLSSRLTHIQHHFHGRVLATTHVHLDEHLCSEMIMARGRAIDIKHLTDRLRREKGVLHANLAISSTGQQLR